MNDYRIPVTIVTGFLGAGKTTLLNNIIRKYPEKKFAFIENEIGEIGIDGGLIVGTKDNIFELSNGCICCSLNDDFYEVINRLMDSDHVFNHLLIETTGIADPTSIIKAFASNETIQQQFRIDSVVCLADALNLEYLINTESEIRKQLALSDTILLNKAGDVSPEKSEELMTTLLTINPMATVRSTSHADISTFDVLDTNAYSGKHVATSTLNFQNMAYMGKLHQHEMRATGISIPGSLDADKFNYWMENFLYFNKDDVFRIKGILSFEGVPRQLIFHAVRDIYMIEQGNDWESSDSRFNKLVFIGKKINRDEIETALYQLLANL